MGISADEFFGEEAAQPEKKGEPITGNVSPETFFGEDGQPESKPKRSREGVWKALDIAPQVLAGVHDITGLIAGPLEDMMGGPVFFGDKLVEWLSPQEMRQRRAEGRVGIPGMATEEADNIFGAAARTAGQTAAAGPVLGRLASLVKVPAPAATKLGRLGQLPKKIFAQAGKTFANSPVKTTVAETGLGAAAGAGGYVAAQIFPDSDGAKFIGEIVGGTVPAITPTGLAIRGAYKARDLIRIARHPFTEIGGRQRAAARGQRALTPEQREAALVKLDEPTTLDPQTGKPVLSAAQRADEPGMLSLEKAVMESSEDLLRAKDNHIARANTVIQEALSGLGGDASAATVPIKEAQEYLGGLLDTRIRIAAQRADERIVEMGPKVSREQTNIIAREELDKALDAARLQEAELYSLIPEGTAVPYERARIVFSSLLSQLGRAQLEDMPEVASRFLGKESAEFFGKNTPLGLRRGETTIKEIRALQSKLRAIARNARAGEKKNLNEARIADEIADAITEDLSQAVDGSGVSAAVSAAVTFSRNLNERFNQGTVAKLLGRRVTGAERVPEGLTLEQSIGVSGPAAREAMDDLVKAFDSPEAPTSKLLVESAEDYVRSRFLQRVVERGELNVKAAQRFLVTNQALLDRLPNVRNQIEEVIESGDTLAVAHRQRGRVKLDDPRVSKATMLIQSGPVETFKNINKLQPLLAEKEVQQLINRVSQDSTGEALSGLKAGFMEFLSIGAKESARDATGKKFLSGLALRDALEKPATSAMAKRLFSTEERKRLDIVINDLVRLERSRAATLPAEGVLGDKPSKVIETIAGIAGAAYGRHQAKMLGIGGTVQVPGIMAGRFRDLASAGVKDPAARLIRDAIQDEDLFRELLQATVEEGGKTIPPDARRRLNAWTAAVLAEYGGVFEEDSE